MGFFISVLATDNRSSFALMRRVPEITTRTTEATKKFEVEIDKPLGLILGKKLGGRVVIIAKERWDNYQCMGI